MNVSRKTAISFVSALMILSIIQGASAQGTPYSIAGYIQYENGTHPASITATWYDLTNSQTATIPGTSNTYDAGTGYTKFDSLTSPPERNGTQYNLTAADGLGNAVSIAGTTDPGDTGGFNFGTINLTLIPGCGNNFLEPGLGEECDGSDDDACPGVCDIESCLCPSPLYGVSASPSSISQLVLPSTCENVTETITNIGAYDLLGVELAALSLDGGNIAFTYFNNDVAIAASASADIIVQICANENASTSSGTINVSDDSGNATTQIPVTVSTSAVTRRRGKKNMVLEAARIEGEGYCVGEPVIVTVTRERDGDPLDKVDVDVYLGKKKIFNLESDDDGKTQFTPATAGDYRITAQRSRYRDEELTVTVIDCLLTTTTPPVTTTVPAALTTTAPPETTTAPPETTTAPPVVTTAPPVVTTAPPVVTTTVPPAPPSKLGKILVIIIIVVIGIVVIMYLAGKKGGGGEEAPPAEEKPAE